MDLTSIRLALALFPLDLHVRTGGHQVGCCALFLLETVMRLLPGRGRLMVGPNLSQFEFLSAACELWLLGLRRVRLPVALTPHPKDPRLGKLLAGSCLFTGFCLTLAYVQHAARVAKPLGYFWFPTSGYPSFHWPDHILSRRESWDRSFWWLLRIRRSLARKQS